MRDRWSRILGLRRFLATRLSAANGNRVPGAKKIKGEKAGKLSLVHHDCVLDPVSFR
jgi:hypothetical protein